MTRLVGAHFTATLLLQQKLLNIPFPIAAVLAQISNVGSTSVRMLRSVHRVSAFAYSHYSSIRLALFLLG